MPPVVRIGPNQTPPDLVEVISDTELVATYMGGGLGPEDVEVTTPAGTAVATGAFNALPNPRPPSIAGVDPDSGRGGTRVRILGSGFTEGQR